MLHCKNVFIIDGQGDENGQERPSKKRYIFGNHCQQWWKETVHILGCSLNEVVTQKKEEAEKKGKTQLISINTNNEKRKCRCRVGTTTTSEHLLLQRGSTHTDLVAFAETWHELMVQLVKVTQVATTIERPASCSQRSRLTLNHLHTQTQQAIIQSTK